MTFMGCPGCALFVLGLVDGVSPAHASKPLTLDATLALVRQRSPQVLASNTALAEARAARAGATPLLGENPTISGGAGFLVEPGYPPWRMERAGPTALMEVSLPVEIGLQRSRRIAAADAHIRAASESREESLRQALLAAGQAFYRALHARQMVVVAQLSLKLATASRDAAQRLHEAGELPELDVRLASLDATSARQAVAVALAEYRQMLTQLSALTGLPPEDLRALDGLLIRTDPLPKAEEAVARALRRSDVRALKAEANAALQDANVAAAQRLPTPQLKANYQYWNREHSILTGVEVPLPLFARGQGEEARARARANGLLDEATARERALRAEVLSVLELVKVLIATRQEYAVNGADELKSLVEDAQRNYVERRMDMLTLLTVQRQALQAGRDALDLALREALARLWLDAAMGVLS